MAFVRPLLPVLVERIQQDLVSRLGLEAPILRVAFARILAKVVAGAAHMLHGHLEFLSKQIFPDKAERDYLIRWGALFGLSLTPAEYATGNAACTGTNGKIIPAGAIVRRADGAEYTVDDEVTIAGGTATVALTAVVAGEDGNCDAGAELSFESPIDGVGSTVTVDADEIGGGTDEETIEAFRTRVLERMQSAPHGGNAADYVAWAKEVPGVTRAWCFPNENGPGTVVVRFVRDNDAPGSIIPSSGEVAAVLAHIVGTAPWYLDRLAPVTAVVSVAAPTPRQLDFDLTLEPNTEATRAAVTASLEALLLRIARPGGTIPLSQIQIAVGTSDGVSDFTINSPSADVVHAVSEMAVMGEVTT
jgi:uncharacterized phage protein gp47/JayE